MMSCCSTKQTASKKVLSFKVQDSREQEARDSVRLELRDTLKEVTTVTVQLNETGDTIKVSTVTDRTRASVRDRMRNVELKTVMKTDTMCIERRDSVIVYKGQVTGDSSRALPVVQTLKWAFWIIIAIIMLTITITITRVFWKH